MNTEFFNDNDLNLTLLMEECAEVIHICSKIKRFGLEDCHPEGDVTNKTRLEQELGDIAAITHIVTRTSGLSAWEMHTFREKKLEKLKKYYRRLEE